MLNNFSNLLTLALFTFLIILALSGNLLVCFAIFFDRKLRSHPENLFLVSLAVSDLFVSVFVMIFAASNDILEYWPFGEAYCQFWICFDITCSTASILNLCAIALDRYLHISRPMIYARYSNKSTISLAIVVVWLLSALIGLAQIIFGASGSNRFQIDFVSFNSSLFSANNNFSQNIDSNILNLPSANFYPNLRLKPTCQLTLSPLYAIVSSTLSFFLPATIMVLLYTKLYFYARMHVQSIRSQLKQATSLLIIQMANGCTKNQRLDQVVLQPYSIASQTTLNYGKNNNINNFINYKNNNKSMNNSYSNVDVNATAHIEPTTTLLSSTAETIDTNLKNLSENSNSPNSSSEIKKIQMTINRSASEQKARLTLGVIMGTFLISWLPFFIINIWRSLFPHFFSQRVFQIVTWLGYVNSTANPIIYGIFNRDFRQAFSKIVFKIFYCFQNNFDSNYKSQRSPYMSTSKL